VDSTGEVGRSASLFVNPTTDKPSIAYSDSTHKTVKYASYQTKGAWHTETAAKTSAGAAYISGTFADDPKLAVAYYDLANGDLVLASKPISNWILQTLVSKKDVGLFNSIAVRDGEPFIYSYNRTRDSAFLIGLLTPTSTGVVGGGRYLSAYTHSGWTDLAY